MGTEQVPMPKVGRWETVYENPYQQIRRVAVDFGDFSKVYFVNCTGTRAGLVAARNGAILLVQQYRLLINRLSWEIPGGRVDQNETPEAAAARECLEETGIRCFNLRPLVFYYPGLDTLDNPTYLFYTDEVAETSEAGSIHTEEVSGLGWRPLTECIEMMFTGEIVDGFTISALLAYRALPDPMKAR